MWEMFFGKTEYGGDFLMEFSEAFEKIKRELLSAKLYAYGFSKMSY